MDIYGFCIPPKEYIFPHLSGYINGFGRKPPNFEVWTEHHIKDKDKNKEYDFSIYGIVKFFQLCMDNNPNMIDSLFVPQNCVLHQTRVATMVRDNRKMFLHKGCYHKFRGYSFAQLHKAEIKNPKEGSKRYEDIKNHGYDSKFLYHVVRLLDECEQILTLGDLDLQKSKEYLKAIRRGEVSEEDVKSYFNEKEKYLNKCYEESKIPYSPDEDKIKTLLLNCLEDHYGSLEKAYFDPGKAEKALMEIKQIIERNVK
jgi:predicted nucleotidyltransferase